MRAIVRVAGVALAAIALGCGCGEKDARVRAVAGTATFTDPLTNPIGEHATVVEPASAAGGQTVVTVFQVGRTKGSGASAVGWGTSTDGGATWKHGLLPHVTVHQPERGRFVRVSDPVVARDSVHDVWIASYLALTRLKSGFDVDVVSSRSRDGVDWDDPVVITKRFDIPADKDWIVCDNGDRSPHAGTCYAAWTLPGYPRGSMGSAATRDGGKTWSAVRTLPQEGFGVQPLVRPDGSITLVELGRQRMETRDSSDGLRTVSRALTIGKFRATFRSMKTRIRSEVLPTAVITRKGTEFVAWRDCRDPKCATNGIVVARSIDGRAWTPTPVAFDGPLDSSNLFLPALGVRPDGGKLALLFMSLSPPRCPTESCRVRAYVAFSSDQGRTWKPPRPLSPAMRLRDFPSVLAHFAFMGDYMAVSFTGDGSAVATYPVARPARGTAFRQGISTAVVRP